MKNSKQSNELTTKLTNKERREHILPVWADALAIGRITGIGRSTLYSLADRGLIKTASLKERDQLRGKRLFSVESVLSFIEARATGGDQSE